MSVDVKHGRVGLLIQRRNATIEPEAYSVFPDGVSGHIARLDGTGDTEEGLAAMRRDLPRAAATLATLNLASLIFACTAATFYQGRRSAEALGRELSATSPAATLTAGACVVAALRAVGARRVVVLTPYREWLTVRLVQYLREYGVETADTASLGLTQGIDRVSGDAWVGRVRQLAARGGCNAVFISCTNLPTLHVLASLEDELGLPVLSSNQAIIWAALRHVGRRSDDLLGFGSLFGHTSLPPLREETGEAAP